MVLLYALLVVLIIILIVLSIDRIKGRPEMSLDEVDRRSLFDFTKEYDKLGKDIYQSQILSWQSFLPYPYRLQKRWFEYGVPPPYVDHSTDKIMAEQRESPEVAAEIARINMNQVAMNNL